ncbi:LamG domain-containing protein, partial [Streptomyces sp. NPDC005899]
ARPGPTRSARHHGTGPATGPRAESPATHTTRPALSATVPGTTTDAPSASTGHPVAPGASAPAGALRSSPSLALTSGGTNSPRPCSGAVTAALGPQLVLTFGAEQ